MRNLDLYVLLAGGILIASSCHQHSWGLAVIGVCAFIVAAIGHKHSYSQVEKPLRGHKGDE